MESSNIYGCTPCPKCGSKYRWPNQQGMFVCDDCGHTEERPPQCPNCTSTNLAKIKGCVRCLECGFKEDCNGW